MKVLLKLLVFTLPMMAFHLSLAQLERTHIPPSPTASATVDATAVNMNYYTGVANITIPLHNLTGKDISIPISLDYQTTGVKVADISSPVGLGWNLNASSFAITRMVRGLPDGSIRNCDVDATGKHQRYEIPQTNFENCDAERDIFFFSYPSRAGKMFLDNAGVPQTIPYQDLLISPGVGAASIGYWKIIDELGYTYYFGESTGSREETTYFVGNKTTGVFTQKHTFISTWYLTRIESPRGAQIATFTYSTGSNVTYYKTGARVTECVTSGTIPNNRVDMKIQINSPKYISTIVTDGASSGTTVASCDFSYDNNRQDLSGALRLASMTIKDHTGTVKRKFHLEAGCFQEFLGSCRRLKLQSIKEGIQNPYATHTFLYNEGSLLPPEESFFTDHYGYYNRDSQDVLYDANTSVGHPEYSVPRVDGVCTSGRFKDPSALATAAILNEVQLTSGARTVFTYNSPAGAQIASISNYSGSDLVARSVFSYSGQTYLTPVYHYYNVENSNSLIRSSNAYNSVFDLNGVSIGNTTVTETFLDGSKVERTFYNFSDFADSPPIVGRYKGGTNPAFQATSDANSSPFAPHSSKAWMRGLPKTITVKDANNNPLQKEEYNYQAGDIVSTVWNMAVELYRNVPGDNGFYVGDYMLQSQQVRLSYKTSYTYDQTDFSKSNSMTTVYYYHSTHKTFPEHIDMNYGWHSKRITYRYPIDLTGSGSEPSNPDPLAAGVWALKNWHIITSVEQLEYRQDEATLNYLLIGGQLSTFRKNAINSRPLLKELYVLNRASADASFTPISLSGGIIIAFDNNYQLMQTFNYDDATAGNNVNLTSTTDSKGITSNYEYGYNNTLLTADYNSLGSTQFRNEYTYNTVNGLLTQSDVNNQLTSYEYDNFGRLKLVKDNGGNIVSRYRYNTKSISEFNIGLSTSVNIAITNQTVTITSTENGEPAGVTKYIWDYGDGQIAEGTSTVVTHSYSAPGTYTIKLSKVNPEYGKLLTTKQITINPPPSVNITSSCSSIDLCAQNPHCDYTASGSGGCSALTYTWYYSYAGGGWTNFGSGTGATFYPALEGTYQIKCTVSDSCSNTAESTSSVQVYRSTPGCPIN